MSIERRIGNLEKRHGDTEGCQLLIVVYEGTTPPSEGAARQYIKDNKLCEGCTRKDGRCVLYWNGEKFVAWRGGTNTIPIGGEITEDVVWRIGRGYVDNNT